jgi:hypothetical protein
VELLGVLITQTKTKTHRDSIQAQEFWHRDGERRGERETEKGED